MVEKFPLLILTKKLQSIQPIPRIRYLYLPSFQTSTIPIESKSRKTHLEIALRTQSPIIPVAGRKREKKKKKKKKHVSQHAPCPLFEMESVNWAGEMGITAGCTSVDVYGIERCAHKDMRVHGTTPRARSAVHTSLIRAGVKPVVRGAGHKRGAQQRTNRVHPNWTGNLVACPTNLAHNPPLPPLFPRSRLNRARPSIHRITRSSSFSRGQSIEGGGLKGPAGNGKIRIVSDTQCPLCRAFVRNSLIKRCHAPCQPFPSPSSPVVGCDPSNLPISFFRQGAPSISIVRAAVRLVNKTVRQSCSS